MKVLVTGGAGYVGGAVVAGLVAAGTTPVVLDDLSTGHRRTVPAGVPLVEGSIADLPLLERTLRDHSVTVVIHMAASCLVGESVADPGLYYRNNVVAGLSLLEGMRISGVDRIVFSSSAATYGDPRKTPIPEEAPTSPTNPYGETKLAFEGILRWYQEAYGIRHVNLRYFNAAGSSGPQGEDHDPETHLIPLVLKVALGQSEGVDVYGDDYPTPDGTCIRDYIHVEDLARAHLLALEAVASGSRTYNLGGGKGASVREVIRVARQVTGHPIPEREAPRRPGDPAVLVASADRIERELGWKPARSDLGSIIESAWSWHRAHPEGYGDG